MQAMYNDAVNSILVIFEFSIQVVKKYFYTLLFSQTFPIVIDNQGNKDTYNHRN